MTGPLRHVARAMLGIRYRLLVIAMICASTFGVLAGAYSAIDSLFTTVNTIQAQGRMADIELLFGADDLKNLPPFEQLPNVAQVYHRLLMTGQMLQPQAEADHQQVSALMVASHPDLFNQVNRLSVLQGELPSNDNIHGVALERNCAAFYHKQLGDKLTLKIGYVEYALEVQGIVQSPEYLIAPLNPSVYVPTNGSLCVMFGVERLLHEQLGFEAVNSVLLQLKNPASMDDTKTQALELAHTRLSVDYGLTRYEQFSQKFLELDLNTFKVFLPAVVLVFALSSVLAVFFLMYQWIKEERPLIAMFLVLGYGRQRIIAAYLLPAGLIVLAAWIMGVFVGYFDMWAFAVHYAQGIGMPDPELTFQWRYLLWAALLILVTVAVGMALPIRSLTRVHPIDALRDVSTTDTTGGSQFFESLAARIQGPFWLRYALRNMLRSWQVSLVSILAVSASLAVTISFYISITSMESTAIGSVRQDRWEAVVDLEAPWWDDELGRLQQAIPGSSWSLFVKGGAQVVSPGRSDNAYLLGIQPEESVRNVNLIAGRDLVAKDERGVIVERRLSVDHRLSIGSPVQLKVRGEIHNGVVVGIHSSAVPGEVIVPRPFAQKMLVVEEQFTGAFLVKSASATVPTAALYNVPGVVRVTDKANIVDAILSISGHIWVIIHLSALMSITVSGLFVLTSTTFSIVGRRGEYGVLRTMGYDDRTITKIVLTEAICVALLAGVLALPLGYVLGYTLNDQLTEVWFKVNTAPSVGDFMRVVLPALLLIPAATWPAIRMLLRIHPIDTLKERRFG